MGTISVPIIPCLALGYFILAGYFSWYILPSGCLSHSFTVTSSKTRGRRHRRVWSTHWLLGRNDSIISVSAIQYTWDIYHTYMLPFFSSFSYNLRILERSILFFVLASTFPNESRGMSHYDLNCIYLDCIFLFHFSYPFLSP